MPTEPCQATKRVVQKSGNFFIAIPDPVRCNREGRHDGDHHGEHPVIVGPDFTWPRGKQPKPFFLIQPQGG